MTLTAMLYALAYAAASTYGIVLLIKMARRDEQQTDDQRKKELGRVVQIGDRGRLRW